MNVVLNVCTIHFRQTVNENVLLYLPNVHISTDDLSQSGLLDLVNLGQTKARKRFIVFVVETVSNL